MADSQNDDALEVQTPILENMVVGVPPVFEGLTRQLDKMVEQPLLGPRTTYPAGTAITPPCAAGYVQKLTMQTAGFTCAHKDETGRRKPQAIAHRGFKAKFPENTMGAFRGAVEVGADGLETDIHLSKDGVVVLSHVSFVKFILVLDDVEAEGRQDKDLKRCFGRQEKIIDCEWEFLSKLKTLKEPHESMPRLADLLEYLAQPGMEEIWVMLDIKVRVAVCCGE
jgi:hypothetical protein